MKTRCHRVILMAIAMLLPSLGSGCGGATNDPAGGSKDVAPNQPKSQVEYLNQAKENAPKPKG